jgi:hypothetical protein
MANNNHITAILAVPNHLPANDQLPFKSMFDVPAPIRRIARDAFDMGMDLDEIARTLNMPRHWIAAFAAEK